MADSRWPETPVVITTPPTEGVEHFGGVWTWSGRMRTHPVDGAASTAQVVTVCDTGDMAGTLSELDSLTDEQLERLAAAPDVEFERDRELFERVRAACRQDLIRAFVRSQAQRLVARRRALNG